MGSVQLFVFILMVQLFWSFGITIFAHTIPIEQQQFVSIYLDNPTGDTLQNIPLEVEDNTRNQLEIPVLDTVTLIMFTGNILMDLILNFLTAIPTMFILLVEGIVTFIPIEATLLKTLKLLLWVTATILYMIAIVTTLSNLRSSRGVN